MKSIIEYLIISSPCEEPRRHGCEPVDIYFRCLQDPDILTDVDGGSNPWLKRKRQILGKGVPNPNKRLKRSASFGLSTLGQGMMCKQATGPDFLIWERLKVFVIFPLPRQ